jgi:hypothetical protein
MKAEVKHAERHVRDQGDDVNSVHNYVFLSRCYHKSRRRKGLVAQGIWLPLEMLKDTGSYEQ